MCGLNCGVMQQRQFVQWGGNKPLTENIPNIDKTVREGRQLGRSAVSVQTAPATGSGTTEGLGEEITVKEGNGEYTLLDRLYSTTWYRSEKDYDDGRLEEIEEEFVYFNEDSSISKREYENGRPDDTDYAKLKYLESFRTPLIDEKENTNANACIVENLEKDDDDDDFDVDFEGYYLADENTLYIVDGDDHDTIKDKLTNLLKRANSADDFQRYDDDDDDIKRYVLSTRRG